MKGRRYETVLRRFDQLTEELSKQEVVKNQPLYRKLARERSELEDVTAAIRRFMELERRRDEDRQVIESGGDTDLVELARAELPELERELEELDERIQMMLLPRDPDDSRNTVFEIRAGTGGHEATLFAADLARMYRLFAESKGWKVEILSSNPSEIGGYKEIIFLVKGDNAYGKLKFERGVHRVQRVPVTEAGGRIHTSAVSVAVLPEAEEVDVELDPKELRIDVFRSSGPGGQSVNTTDSAVRVTHLPTGLVVTCQDEKSQHKNKAKALKVLRARLYEKAMEEQAKEQAEARRNQVSTGDRSAKIRTYNYPQSRVTDHRIGMTVHGIEQIMDGEIDRFIDALATHYQAEQMSNAA
jgi:peptide chain release factor 1